MIINIPKATPSNNEIKGMHHQKYKRLRNEFAWLVKAETDWAPEYPIEQCEITITRYASRLLDWDNCYGGIKPLMDCLVSATKANPSGLGLILDDNPNVVINLKMQQEKCKRTECRTVIKISEIS